ncbi:D-alanyl-D-alanine carboxypeptidase family protein [Fluviibacterium sp. DFM31]|uniref:serine-type D-Ala-D-Ala carboxypeptidase n=1 Tax=Meridianimarinicoccus marinus TaxID=3231483 RepID=A0ABV3L4E3_9RHOB
MRIRQGPDMLRAFVTTGLTLALLALPAAAQTAFETQARAAYVVDLGTDTVLLEKQPDIALPPASMSKLMTLLMLFEALRDNPNVTLDTRFGVSTKARQMGGSTMFLNERDRPSSDELIKGIIVQSGNDATVVVAEGLAGTEDAFARMMNARAKELGMENSTFANASGWPNPNHRMSVRDLAVLAEHLIEDFPEYYGFFAMPEYEYDGRAPDNRFNRNPLLKLDIGADGLKTGHTEEAGYGLVGSARQGTRRIVFVVTGLPSAAARAQEAERIVSWAFRQFVEIEVAEADERIAEADVWMGNVQKIGLVAPDDLKILTGAVQNDVAAEVVFESPIQAPIAAGQPVAELVITRPGLPEARLPLVSDQDVTFGGFVPRLRSAGQVLLSRVIGQAEGLF